MGGGGSGLGLGFGLRVQGKEFMVQHPGLRVHGLGFEVWRSSCATEATAREPTLYGVRLI